MVEDHYEVLNVSPTASVDEVKRAYRSLSRHFHPDKAGPNMDEASKREHERRMIALNIAYQALMSPRQRRAYDLSREPAAPKFSSHHQTYHGAYASAAAARRAASRGRPSAPAPAPAAEKPSAPAGAAADYSSVKSSGASSLISTSNVPKPRYQTGGKYTQRARQARRMDPSQYTTHVDGRAAEFEGFDATHLGTAVPSTSGIPRHPTWLQRQLDRAREWEEAHCPTEPEEEKYQWRKASDNWLRNIRERKSAREQLGEEIEQSAL